MTIGLLRTAKRGHVATSSRAAPCVSDAGTGDEADDSEPYHVCAVAANADYQTAPQLDGRRGLAAAIERGAHRCHLFLIYIDCHPSMEAGAVLRDRNRPPFCCPEPAGQDAFMIDKREMLLARAREQHFGRATDDVRGPQTA